MVGVESFIFKTSFNASALILLIKSFFALSLKGISIFFPLIIDNPKLSANLALKSAELFARFINAAGSAFASTFAFLRGV